MKDWFWNILGWLVDHIPVRCEVCHAWLWRMDVRFERAVTGYKVAMCDECHAKIFEPISFGNN